MKIGLTSTQIPRNPGTIPNDETTFVLVTIDRTRLLPKSDTTMVPDPAVAHCQGELKVALVPSAFPVLLVPAVKDFVKL